MRKFFFVITLSIVCLYATAQQNWHLDTEKDGITVHTANVADSKVKAIKVGSDFKATLSQMMTVLLDIKTGPEWEYKTMFCTLVKQVSPSELYYHSEVNLPWPASNRDFVAHLTVTQNPETKVVDMESPAVPGFVPVKKGVVRIEHSTGKWVITPLGEGRIHVAYTLQFDPGGNIPAWLVNLFASDGPVQSFKMLRLQVQKPAYKGAVLPFIKD